MSTKTEWREYEKAVFQECKRIFKTATVKHDVKLDGKYSLKKRQIDVLVSNGNIDGVTTSIAIDTKHYAIKIDVKCVESFIGMLQDIDVSYGIIISDIGFTSGAINRVLNGPENIQIDIMSMSEFSKFQGLIGIPYAGDKGAVVQSPFGWVIDGKRYGIAPAVLYRRGSTFEEACKNFNFMYINFYHHDNESIVAKENVCDIHNSGINDSYNNPEISMHMENDVLIREFYNPMYDYYDVTAYKDFKDCTIFVSLLTKKEFKQTNMQKLRYTINSLIPLNVRQGQE